MHFFGRHSKLTATYNIIYSQCTGRRQITVPRHFPTPIRVPTSFSINLGQVKMGPRWRLSRQINLYIGSETSFITCHCAPLKVVTRREINTAVPGSSRETGLVWTQGCGHSPVARILFMRNESDLRQSVRVLSKRRLLFEVWGINDRWLENKSNFLRRIYSLPDRKGVTGCRTSNFSAWKLVFPYVTKGHCLELIYFAWFSRIEIVVSKCTWIKPNGFYYISELQTCQKANVYTVLFLPFCHDWQTCTFAY